MLFVLWVGSHGVLADTREVVVNNPNALGKVAHFLRNRHGVAISFEGPTYEYHGDLVDIRRRAMPTAQDVQECVSPGAILSRFCYFRATYTVDPITQDPTNMTVALKEIVDQYNRDERNPGRFEVIETIAGPSIVPTAIRMKTGDWKSTESVLDTPISLSVTNVSSAEAYEAIVRSLAAAAGATIKPGWVRQPQGQITLRAENESVRNVLARLITNPEYYGGTNNCWVWFYAPCPPEYGLEDHLAVRGSPVNPRDKSPWSMVGNVTHPDYRGEQEAAAQGSTP
jgi:hypothetical protein